MRQLRFIGRIVFVFALYLFAVQADAQSTAPLAPIGPIRESTERQVPVAAARLVGTEAGFVGSSAESHPDTHTLSSIEQIGLGSVTELQSFLDPSFRIGQTMDTGIVAGKTNSVTQMGFNLAFDRPGKRSRLMGSYGGAHTFYSPSSSYNSNYHNFAAAAEYEWARWVLRVRDDLMESQESTFGGLYNSGANAQLAYQAADTGSDSILTARAMRINNTAGAELDYLLSRRATLTLSGLYKSLSFSGTGFLNTHGPTANIGYDYALSPNNAVGLSFGYSLTDFNLGLPALRTETSELSFGRRLTGKLALKVSAGAQFSSLGANHRTDWTASNALTYQIGRSQYSFEYARGVGGGSGVLGGAITNRVTAAVHFPLGPFWGATFGGGYARNQALTAGPGGNNSFGNGFANASLGRNVGQHMALIFTYALQQQSAGTGTTCATTVCGLTGFRQVGGITLEFHPWAMRAR